MIRRPILLLFCFLLGGEAFQADQDEWLKMARGFIRALYPDLEGIGKEVVTKTDSVPMGLKVSLYPNQRVNGAEEAALSATFFFGYRAGSAKAEVVSLWARGAFERNLQEARLEVDQHPNWSASRVASVLRQVGALYGPDRRADFIRQLPLARLRPFTGSLQVAKAEFMIWTRAADGNTLEAALEWMVYADGRESAEWEERHYLITFEPFRGRVTSFKSFPH